jgi:hypothetical protein
VAIPGRLDLNARGTDKHVEYHPTLGCGKIQARNKITAYLCVLRLYTWAAAMLFLEYSIVCHGHILQGFHKDWSSLHLSRMARSLNIPSACPFAMVIESENDKNARSMM